MKMKAALLGATMLIVSTSVLCIKGPGVKMSRVLIKEREVYTCPCG